MLVLKNIYKKVRLKNGRTKQILENININLSKNGIYILTGESGSGKSSLLNIISGLDKDYTGDVIINKNSKSHNQSSDLRKNTIDYVFQDLLLFDDKTVSENIEIMYNVKNKSRNHKLLHEVIEILELKPHYHKLVEELSLGEKQRVAIARAIISNNKILLLDEPTNSLDERMKIKVMELLRKLAKRKIIIMSTHDLHIAELYTNEIFHLHKGGILHKQIDNIKDKPSDNQYNKTTDFFIPNLKKRKVRLKKVDLFFLVMIFIVSLTLTFTISLCTGETYIRDEKVNVHRDLLYIEGKPKDVIDFYENNKDNNMFIVPLKEGRNEVEYNIHFYRVDSLRNVINIHIPVFPIPISHAKREKYEILGNYPKNNLEILVDIKILTDSIHGLFDSSYPHDFNNLLDIGIRKYDGLIGEEVLINNKIYTISGLVDERSGNVYLDDWELMNHYNSKYVSLDDSYSLLSGRYPVYDKNQRGFYEGLIEESIAEKSLISIGDIYNDFEIVGISADNSGTHGNEVITHYDNIVKKSLSGGDSRLYKVVDQKANYIENNNKPGITIVDAYKIQKQFIQHENNNNTKIFLIINIIFLLILLASYSVIKSIKKMKKNSIYIFLGMKNNLVVFDNLKENAFPTLFTVLLGYLMGLIVLLLNYNALKLFAFFTITPLLVVLVVVSLIILILIINIILTINILFTSPITLIKNTLKDK